MEDGKGHLVISLDFELLWGVFDKVDYSKKFDYFKNTRRVIPQILNLFQEYEIACSWASVGMLFNKNWKEWDSNMPLILPEYLNNSLSAYKYGNTIASSETEEICFAPDLIALINGTPRQEIATHTYSHYYCLERGQDFNAFEADLGRAVAIAREKGMSIKTLVFPRNQFNADYLTICRKMGITSVRTNPDVWYWQNTQNDSLFQKIFRTGDAYVGENKKSYKSKSFKIADSGVVLQKASRLLRPYSGNNFLEYLKIRRIKKEMTKAARTGEVYHLWWHPHNFGNNPQENLNQLEEILRHFKSCQKKYNFGSVNMGELTEIVNAK